MVCFPARLPKIPTMQHSITYYLSKGPAGERIAQPERSPGPRDGRMDPNPQHRDACSRILFKCFRRRAFLLIFRKIK